MSDLLEFTRFPYGGPGEKVAICADVIVSVQAIPPGSSEGPGHTMIETNTAGKCFFVCENYSQVMAAIGAAMKAERGPR